MGNTKRRIAVFAAAAVFASTALTGCGKGIDNNATVITIGEDKVTMDVANFFARHQQAIAQMQYSSMFGEDFWGMSFAQGGPTMEEDVKDNVLENLENMYVLEDHMADYNVELGGPTMEEDVKDNVLENLENMYVLEDHMADYNVELTADEKAKIEEAAKAFTKANKEEVLEKVSGSEKTVSRVLELATIQEKMRRAMIADVDTNVSDEEAAQKSMQYVFFSFTKTDDEGKSSYSRKNAPRDDCRRRHECK